MEKIRFKFTRLQISCLGDMIREQLLLPLDRGDFNRKLQLSVIADLQRRIYMRSFLSSQESFTFSLNFSEALALFLILNPVRYAEGLSLESTLRAEICSAIHQKYC
jgi:hypothetical protein